LQILGPRRALKPDDDPAPGIRRHVRRGGRCANQYALVRGPTDPSAEVAALLLLDSLVAARSPNLREVVDAMAADLTFVTGKDALLRALQRLRG
jgi:hypothetical protein